MLLYYDSTSRQALMVLVIILLLSSYFQSFYIIFFYLPQKNIIGFCLLNVIFSWTNTVVVFQIFCFISSRQSLLMYPRWLWTHNPFASVYCWDCRCAKCDLKNVNSSKPVSTVFLVFRLLKIFFVYFLLSFEDWWNFMYSLCVPLLCQKIRSLSQTSWWYLKA